jgi:hypothetical protein
VLFPRLDALVWPLLLLGQCLSDFFFWYMKAKPFTCTTAPCCAMQSGCLAQLVHEMNLGTVLELDRRGAELSD